jgi:hypothetical protein
MIFYHHSFIIIFFLQAATIHYTFFEEPCSAVESRLTPAVNLPIHTCYVSRCRAADGKMIYHPLSVNATATF